MNEQQIADLFSEQIDRMLAGQAIADFQGLEELSELFDLGQDLSQVNFQASPAAQAAFQTQLSGWFGSSGGGLSATILGSPKIWLVGILTAITLLGAALGLMGLFKADAPLTRPQERINAPATVELPPTSTPMLAEDGGADNPSPKSSSTIKDTLPAAPPALGDTLPTPVPSSEPTVQETDEPTRPLPADTPSTAADDGAGDGDDNDPPGDHDRGHGNDPDGYDEDNPGNSSGLPGGGDGQDNNGAPGNIGRGQENDNDNGGGSPQGGENGGGNKGKGDGKK